MKLFFLIASLLFAKFNAENWHPHDDFEFLLSATEKNFIEAAKSCDSLGATLARINTEKVELFLGSLINSNDCFYVANGNAYRFHKPTSLVGKSLKDTCDSLHDGEVDDYKCAVCLTSDKVWKVKKGDGKKYICQRNLVYCPSRPVLMNHQTVTVVTFPKTLSGYSNQSLEACSKIFRSAGTPLAQRACLPNGEWEHTIWLSSCKTSLQDLSEKNLISKEDRLEAASDLVLLTSSAENATVNDVDDAISVIKKLITSSTSREVATLLVECLSNLLRYPKKLFETTKPKRLLTVLDNLAESIDVKEGKEFIWISSEVALSIAVQSTANLCGISMTVSSNNYQEKFGFKNDQIKLERFKNGHNNTNLTIASLHIPSSAINKSSSRKVSFYAFRDDALFQNNQTREQASMSRNIISSAVSVASKNILSATIHDVKHDSMNDLNQNITIVFQRSKNSPSKNSCEKIVCGFWVETTSYWSKENCWTLLNTDEQIKCECNHLTNFAALFVPDECVKDKDHQYVLRLLTIIGCSLSSICCALTVLRLLQTFTSPPKNAQTSTSNFLRINLTISVLLLDVMLPLSEADSITSSSFACQATAIILHFAVFSCFLWMMNNAVYLYLAFAKTEKFLTVIESKRFYLYTLLWGWVFPALFVTLTAANDISVYQRVDDSCWIAHDKMIWFVIVPGSLFIFVNLVLFVLIIYCKRVNSKKTRVIRKKNFIDFAYFFFVLGISWVFGFLIFFSKEASVVFSYIFTVITSLQGVLFLILFVKCE